MLRGLLAAIAASAAIAGTAHGAQMVVQNMQPVGGVSPSLASALTGILLGELSRVEGMSVISQADVRALLELEANKQMLGCNETSCLTELAGSLGAELLVTSTLSRVGESWIVALTMIRVEKANVARRASGQARGGDEAAAEAVIASVRELFSQGVPTELQGPAAMTQRGFKAALAGFFRATLDPAADAKATRKRIILDLVQTELDYDATPKMEILDLEIRRSIARLEGMMLLSKDGADLTRHLVATEHYTAIAHDLGRVKEIRQRSRERGLVPSARALRFEDPEDGKRIDAKDLDRYGEESKPARDLVKKALDAYLKKDVAAFAKLWKKGYEGNAKNKIESNSDKHYGYTYDLLPLHAMSPRLLDNALDVIKDGKMIVFMRRYKKGEIDDETRVWLEKEGNDWKISSW